MLSYVITRSLVCETVYLEPQHIAFVSLTLSVSLLLFIHVMACLRSVDSLYCSSVMLLADTQLAVSSAYKDTVPVVMFLGMSLTNIMKRRRPNFDQWGTPYFTCCGLDLAWLTFVTYTLSVGCDLNHKALLAERPVYFNFFSNRM